MVEPAPFNATEPSKGTAVAKKRKRTSSRPGNETAPSVAAADETAAGAGPGRRTVARGKGLRRRLRKLERQLADAARQERRRLRKLERALWRRQRLEAAIDEIRIATGLGKSAGPAATSAGPVPRC